MINHYPIMTINHYPIMINHYPIMINHMPCKTTFHCQNGVSISRDHCNWIFMNSKIIAQSFN